MVPSSSGLGRWPLKPVTEGSNPLGITIQAKVLVFLRALTRIL